MCCFVKEKHRMDPRRSTITLTFGDAAENHVGMEMLGRTGVPGSGFQLKDLFEIQERFKEHCEIHILKQGDIEAHILVLRGGVDLLLGAGSSNALFAEQAALDVDKKAFMYGRVVDKHARWNLCFDDASHPPDYAAGKGRVISFSEIPITQRLHAALPENFGPKATDLKCEANYYYDVSKCGIGYHGDTERRKVIGVRLGASLDMYWTWFKDGAPIGAPNKINLHSGDIYVMSEKAVGSDWKKRGIYTLRHATGCAKFTSL
jgi:hypothetical protein